MYYETRVKFHKVDQSGHERKVTDLYLLDAVSYTDAEARIYEIMKELTRSEFLIMSIKKSNITEVISAKDGEWWYKAKISLVSIDEEKGREVKISNYILVAGNDINDAQVQLAEGLSYMIMPYEVVSVTLSKVADVFPYVVNEDEITEVEFEEREEDCRNNPN